MEKKRFYQLQGACISQLGRRKSVRSGIRTHAWRTRLRPERSALDRSAILTHWEFFCGTPQMCLMKRPLCAMNIWEKISAVTHSYVEDREGLSSKSIGYCHQHFNSFPLRTQHQVKLELSSFACGGIELLWGRSSKITQHVCSLKPRFSAMTWEIRKPMKNKNFGRQAIGNAGTRDWTRDL